MSKKRLRFSKLNMAKYISHLDLLRCFTRAILRAELPVKYSQGFNPHQKLSFSLPLSIGVTGECECVDIEFEDTVTDAEIIRRLNDSLPPDIRILAAGEPSKNADDISAARYSVTLHTGGDAREYAERAAEFFALPEVIILKKTKKKGEQPVNLMEFIKDAADIQPEGDRLHIELLLSAGGHGNLKPELAVQALIDHLAPAAVTSYDIHRTEILMKSGEVFD